MPDVSKLPTNLLPLSFPQAMLLRSQSLDDDAERIARRLRILIAQGRPRGLSYMSAGAGAALALTAGIAAGPATLSRLGLPFPGVTLPNDERLRADLDKARDDLTKAVRDRDGVRGELSASRKQLETAKSALSTAEAGIVRSTAALAAAEKSRDTALNEAKAAKADADGWRQKHAALDAQLKGDAARKDKEAKDAADRAARAAAEAARRDPALAIKPGSGQTFRDCPDCPEMVLVPAGSFTMGSPASEERWSGYDGREEPQRTVTFAKPFAVAKFEVTFQEREACVAGGGCQSNKSPGDQSWGKGRRPVINVSWDDAKQYVAWLSRKSGKSYRLLTEAEWEYAARAGTTTPFPTGRTITTAQANFNGDHTYGGSARGQNRQRTVEVGSFAANQFGLHDMHGNVWEWVEDCWHAYYSGAPSDGSAWTTACTDGSRRVVRGGSWGNNPEYLRSAVRSWYSAGDRDYYLGFRLGRTF